MLPRFCGESVDILGDRYLIEIRGVGYSTKFSSFGDHSCATPKMKCYWSLQSKQDVRV
ncbi:hypothetical protein H6F44_10935 [Pseudanabaena sp. FACHB-1277]|uniref:Uncharacterized protein n=1 Tax=Pseudanabaena cinerea FACHB-1277 TaxID=2949581 RepID=A0A926USU7_9CYAN|nr:hypothetical protein [Pseudanabaena cinerea]MBD2150630.1 hypothetical protein [Pseudanabaena cinerea FACHB-1277]